MTGQVRAVLVGSVAATAVFALGLMMAGFKREPVTPSRDVDVSPNRLLTRVLAKDKVLDVVVDGRLSVRQAAAVFAWLNAQPPAWQPPPVNFLPLEFDPPTEAQSHCWQVFAYARALPHLPPARLAELETETVRLCRQPAAQLPRVNDAACRRLWDRMAAVDHAAPRPRTDEWEDLTAELRAVCEQ